MPRTKIKGVPKLKVLRSIRVPGINDKRSSVFV